MHICLVIDESGVVRKVASRILSSLDVEMFEAAGGAEALNKLETLKPNLILLAAALPDMGSDEFVRRARVISNGGETKILAMLVEGNLGLMTRLKRAGTDGFIYKPFNRDDLLKWTAPYLGMADAA